LLGVLAFGAVPLAASPTPGLEVKTSTVAAGGSSFIVSTVSVDLALLQSRVGLAHGRVGPTEELASLARREGALAALNGSYFEAYTSSAIKNPNHTLIRDGQLVNKGNVGSLIGFCPDGQARIDRVPLKIEGALDGSYKYPDNWHAYWVNRLPEGAGTITIFTRAWGPATGVAQGRHVVVSGGRVTEIGEGSRPIPQDGYVVVFRGAKQEQLAGRFRVGRTCEYRVVREDHRPLGFWEGVTEAVGAGPRLVTDGRITCDPAGEAFKDPKITGDYAGARSMVGLTAEGRLLLVTSSGTVRQMAQLMLALGATQAMCMDGGASSGLWAEGHYLTAPGRPISNALLIVKRQATPQPAPPATPDPAPSAPGEPPPSPPPFEHTTPLPTAEPSPEAVIPPSTLAPPAQAPTPFADPHTSPGDGRPSPTRKPSTPASGGGGFAVLLLMLGLAGTVTAAVVSQGREPKDPGFLEGSEDDWRGL
ncbi:MAG: phosphodiester glycosidase family protein, partial [Armatimonadetes bacterium]|nr:phosphodiester glycosidase family protein [Armatimonadota bacterium]